MTLAEEMDIVLAKFREMNATTLPVQTIMSKLYELKNNGMDAVFELEAAGYLKSNAKGDRFTLTDDGVRAANIQR